MFTGYCCKLTRRDYKNYHYFDGTIEETRVEQARRLGAACCYHWIQSALEGEPLPCYGNEMKKVKYGEDAWVYNQETPRVLPWWLGNSSETQYSCSLETLKMGKECPDYPIKSKYGSIKEPNKISGLGTWECLNKNYTDGVKYCHGTKPMAIFFDSRLLCLMGWSRY